MNYSILLSTCYQNLMDADIDEIPHWQNMADNLKALQKENHIKFDMGNPIEDYVWQTSLDMGLSELEFEMIKPRYHFYINLGLTRQTAFKNAYNEIKIK